jgi:hypothetical protein
MKFISYTSLLVLFIVLTSCSAEQNFKTMTADKIEYVHADGSPILPNECINPDTKYAVAIRTKSEGSGPFQALKVVYTINGVPYIMSFFNYGTEINTVELVDGLNKAEIVGGVYKTYIYFGSQTEYELVP